MNRKQTYFVLALIGLIALVSTSACGASPSPLPVQSTAGEGEQMPTPSPTPIIVTVVVTPTPQPTPTALPTREPTSTPTRRAPDPAPAPDDEPPLAIVEVEAGNVRSGPGLAYPVVGQVSQADSLVVLSRDESSDWLQILWNEDTAWLSYSLVVLEHVTLDDLEVAQAIAPPPTPAPTSTPAPASASASAQAPFCDTVPIRGFGTVWGDHPNVASTLGCPSWPYREQGTEAAVQIFEHGIMLWLASDSRYSADPVYALFDDGEYQRFPDMGPADPAVMGEVAEGFYAPGERFSKVYWEGTGVRVKQRLGRAITPQVDTSGAYQQFDRGRMFWADATDGIFVLYDYWIRGKDDNRIHIHKWTAFEDTFGD
jgi:hypothetical protein